MTELALVGRRKTILISISIIMVSLHTIYFYHAGSLVVETAKVIQQSIRFTLTLALLYFLYKGKGWARIVAIILFSLAVLVGVFAVLAIRAPIVNKVPLIVMVFVFSMALQHFGFSKSYKEFASFQS